MEPVATISNGVMTMSLRRLVHGPHGILPKIKVGPQVALVQI